MSTESVSSTAINRKLPKTSRIGPEERSQIALKVFSGQSPSKVAQEFVICRMSVHRISRAATSAIHKAFTDEDNGPDEVLFRVDVTKAWIKSVVTALALVCHSSYEGIIEIMKLFFDYDICKGTIHNILHKAAERAADINHQADLSAIKGGSLDEIFQKTKPVLVGCDVESTFCFLLKGEESRDSTTWGVHLLDLKERQGLCPEYTIADGGKGLRKGQEDAWPSIPCRSDVFHAIKAMTDLRRYLENRAYGKISALYVLERKMEKAKEKQRGNGLSKQLALARKKCDAAIVLYDDIHVLTCLLKDDILALVGPDLDTRRELLSFVVREMELREDLYAYRIKQARTFLQNQAEDLLRFVSEISQRIIQIAREHGVKSETVREMYEIMGLSEDDPKRWQRVASLREDLGHRYPSLSQAVQKVINKVVRASSVVENLNSRFRNYFFLRKQLGPEYLELLQFYLNHHRFPRSRRKERIGKSPAELLSGTEHENWLDLLGFKPTQKAA